MLAFCAVICGADSWVHVELFAKSQLAWFKTFLELPAGVPSHDTFGRVFSVMNPDLPDRNPFHKVSRLSKRDDFRRSNSRNLTASLTNR